MCLQSYACKHVHAINQLLPVVVCHSPARSTHGKWSRRKVARPAGARSERGVCSSLTQKYQTAKQIYMVTSRSAPWVARPAGALPNSRLFQPDLEAPDSKWSRRGRRRGWRDQQEHCRTGPMFQPDQEAPDSKWSHRGRHRGWRDQQEHVPNGRLFQPDQEGSTLQQMVTSRSVPWVARPAGALTNRAHVPA
jgi:hypothetical protein